MTVALPDKSLKPAAAIVAAAELRRWQHR